MKIKKKFDTFWNFITKKGRMQLKLLKKFVMFMDMVQYRYIRVAQNWFKRFQSENFDVKDLALVNQSLKKSMKSLKKLSKTSTLAVMILVRN